MKNIKPSLRFLLLCNYLSTLGFSMFAPLYALFALGIGAEPLEIGIGWAIYTILSGILIITFGRLEDHAAHRIYLIIGGYFWLAVVTPLFLLVESTLSLYMVLAMSAIGVGMLVPASRAVFGAMEDKGREASEWSLFDGGVRIVMGLAAVLGGLLVKVGGFRAVFLSMFIIQLLAAVVSIKLLKYDKQTPANTGNG